MLNELEQVSIDKTLSQDELQRYLFRLVEDLNFRLQTVSDENRQFAAEVKAGMDGRPGRDGTDGETYYTWVKYSANADGSNMTNYPTTDTEYIGISYNNLSSIESTDPTDYVWSKIKGEEGMEGRGVMDIVNEYYYSTSPDELTGSEWQTSVPQYDPDKYLWVRQHIYYSDGTEGTTTEAHDEELDLAMQRLTTVEGIAGDTSTIVNGIVIDLDQVADRVETAEDLIRSGLASVNESVGSLSTVVTGVAKEITDTATAVGNIREAFENYVTDAGQYMRHSEDGLELGAESSDFKTVIDNQQMKFVGKDGDGNEVIMAYASGTMFSMQNAEIAKGGTLTKGGYQEQVRADGSVMIVWVGI